MARFPAADKAIARLRKWAERPEWSEPLSEIFEMHVGTALGVEADTLFAALDDHSLAVAMGNVLEDLIACEFDDDRNIVDEYLARRGWKLSAPGKRWLKALRHSRASLWEAVALDPGRSMTLKDLLAGGKPIVVDERMGSRSAAPWDRVMARLVTVEGRAYISGPALLFMPEAADAALERFERALKEVRRNGRSSRPHARHAQCLELRADVEGRPRPMDRGLTPLRLLHFFAWRKLVYAAAKPRSIGRNGKF